MVFIAHENFYQTIMEIDIDTAQTRDREQYIVLQYIILLVLRG